MSGDVTIIATAAISAGAAVAGSWIGLLAGRQQIRAEDARQREQRAQVRRDERKAVYGVAIDLITDWLWDESYPPPAFDVLVSFTKPFVHAANAVRIYGSDDAFKAVERFQGAVEGLNQVREDPKATATDGDKAWAEIDAALGQFFDAARDDVGPHTEDFAARLRRSRVSG
jgi:hypothetical protein